jgi:hypothetical protein
MPDDFVPRFRSLQADVESYLTSLGKRERRKDGSIAFRGYDQGLASMFERYLEHEAFEPLVSHFRAWNWETSYNDYLLRLTDALREKRDWPLLKRLWAGVVSGRRKLYNDMTRIEKQSPGTLPAPSVEAARRRLLETLERVRSYSAELGPAEEALRYAQLIDRVNAGKVL